MLKTGIKESEIERKSFQYDILQKFDTLETKLPSLFAQALKDNTSTFTQALKDHESATKKQLTVYLFATEKQLAAYSLDQQKQLTAYSIDQQKQFSNLYSRSLFSVSLTLYVIYQFLTQSRCWVSQCS